MTDATWAWWCWTSTSTGDTSGTVLVERPPAGLVCGMQVGGGRNGVDLVHPAERSDAGLERLECLHVLHVADVLADPRPSTGRDTAGVLQLSTDGDQWWHVDGEVDGDRRVASRDLRIGWSRPSTMRTTESSQGISIGRSCVQNASASPASRSWASASS